MRKLALILAATAGLAQAQQLQRPAMGGFPGSDRPANTTRASDAAAARCSALQQELRTLQAQNAEYTRVRDLRTRMQAMGCAA